MDAEPYPAWLPKPPAEWMLGTSVEARNALQQSGAVHPYTCGNADCRTALTATVEGWVCGACGYTQKLAV